MLSKQLITFCREAIDKLYWMANRKFDLNSKAYFRAFQKQEAEKRPPKTGACNAGDGNAKKFKYQKQYFLNEYDFFYRLEIDFHACVYVLKQGAVLALKSTLANLFFVHSC